MNQGKDPTGEISPPEGGGGLSTTRVLMRQAQQGNHAALSALLSRYRPRLQRWAAGRVPRRLRGVIDTEDLVQNALLRTVEKLEGIERSGAFHGYLRKAISNGLRDQIRRRRDTALEEPDALVDPHPEPDREAINRELMEHYERALETFSERERAAVIARLEWRVPFRELADDLDYPTSDAARMAVTRAVVLLAKRMQTSRRARL